ncbi:MAG TPA: nuclear transport factor 2 family protein [Bryobacteraceae bacterium]|nr:nuclear transport factor 2 family protein [Bryobacteraceae bacterium]
MFRRTLIALAAAGLSVRAQTAGAAAADARKALDSFISAVKANDVKSLSRLMADDLIYTHSTGLVESKQEYLDKLKSGDQKYAGIELINPKIRAYGNTAVINTQARMTGSTKGVPFDNTLFLVHVWVKQGPEWQLVAHQTTRKQ